MSHSITSRRGSTRRCWWESRTGSPPVRRLDRSVRRMSMSRPWGPRSRRRRRRTGVASSSWVISRYSRASSWGSSASKLLPARTSSSLAIATGTSTSAPCSPSAPSRGGAGVTPAPAPATVRRPVRGRSSGGAGAVRASPALGRSGAGSPNTEANTALNALTWARSDTNTPRAVQYSRRRLIGRTSVSARANSAGRSGVMGRPASSSRRLNAPASGGRSSSIVSTPKRGRPAVIRCARAARGRPRGSPPGPRRT